MTTTQPQHEANLPKGCLKKTHHHFSPLSEDQVWNEEAVVLCCPFKSNSPSIPCLEEITKTAKQEMAHTNSLPTHFKDKKKSRNSLTKEQKELIEAAKAGYSIKKVKIWDLMHISQFSEILGLENSKTMKLAKMGLIQIIKKNQKSRFVVLDKNPYYKSNSKSPILIHLNDLKDLLNIGRRTLKNLGKEIGFFENHPITEKELVSVDKFEEFINQLERIKNPIYE